MVIHDDKPLGWPLLFQASSFSLRVLKVWVGRIFSVTGPVGVSSSTLHRMEEVL